MKLNSKQVPAFLKNPAHNCSGALVYGVDEGQVREYAQAIARAIVADVNDPFSVTELAEDQLKTEPVALHDALFAMNLMGGRRLVRLEASSETTGKFLSEIFSETVKPEAYLLVTARELQARSILRALFEKENTLAAIACYKDEGYQLDALIQQRFREADIRADRAVTDYLSANLGNDRRVTLNELDKMILYAGDTRSLSLEEAMELVGNSAELTLDDLCAAVADSDWRAVERILQKLMREAVQPIQVIRALQRYFQRLHLLVNMMRQQRMSADQVIGECKPKVFFKQVPVLRRQLASWQAGTLESVLELLTQAERGAKETGASTEAQLRHYVTRILAIGYKQRRAS